MSIRKSRRSRRTASRRRRARMKKTGPGQSVRSESRRKSRSRVSALTRELRGIRADVDREAEQSRGNKRQRLAEAAELLEEARNLLRDA